MIDPARHAARPATTAATPATGHDTGHDAIVAAAYEAAAGSGSWERVCATLADAFDLWGVQILGVVKAHGSPMFSFEGGRIAPEARLRYMTTYHAINPRIAHASRIPLGGWFHDREHFAPEVIASHTFFRDFVTPSGCGHMSATKLLESDEVVVFVGLHRAVDAPPMSATDIARFDGVREHLSRALSLFAKLQRDRPRPSVDRALLDVLDQATLTVDPTRLVAYRNPAAARLLDSGGALCERDGFLDTREHEGSLALATAFHEMHLALRPDAPGPLERRIVRLAPVAGRPEQLLVLVPVRPELTMAAFGESPCVLVLVQSMTPQARFDPLLASIAFALTPSEADVAAGIAAGRSPERIATDRGVALATVRAQLRSIHEKVGVNRQADLVRRLLSLPRFAAPDDPDAGRDTSTG